MYPKLESKETENKRTCSFETEFEPMTALLTYGNMQLTSNIAGVHLNAQSYRRFFIKGVGGPHLLQDTYPKPRGILTQIC